MHIDAHNDLRSRGRTEPECDAGQTDQEVLLISIAVSLKRIADMLDGTTLGINCAEPIFNPATVQNRDVRNHY